MLLGSLDAFASQGLTMLLAFCRVWATQLQSAVDSLITGTGTGPGTQNCTTVYPELQASKGLLLSSVQGLNGCHSLCSAFAGSPAAGDRGSSWSSALHDF